MIYTKNKSPDVRDECNQTSTAANSSKTFERTQKESFLNTISAVGLNKKDTPMRSPNSPS